MKRAPTLILVLKAPVADAVKIRLGATLGVDEAVAMCRGLVERQEDFDWSTSKLPSQMGVRISGAGLTHADHSVMAGVDDAASWGRCRADMRTTLTR